MNVADQTARKAFCADAFIRAVGRFQPAALFEIFLPRGRELCFCDADLAVAAPRVSELGEGIARLETEIAALRRLYEQAKGQLTIVSPSQGHH
jgi:hypothetical protein